jgi:ABC-type phosphonate transport system ATPase subunit
MLDPKLKNRHERIEHRHDQQEPDWKYVHCPPRLPPMRGRIQSVADVSFSIAIRGRHWHLVGESGSGKSVTSLSLMGSACQRPRKPAWTAKPGLYPARRHGSVDLLALPEDALRAPARQRDWQ